MPFSLILAPAELNTLRKVADQRGTSVANVIRSALHQTIFKHHPDLAAKMLENEVDAFLARLSEKLPGGGPKGAAKARLKKQLVRGLIGK
jgi:hypothetical protein